MYHEYLVNCNQPELSIDNELEKSIENMKKELKQLGSIDTEIKFKESKLVPNNRIIYNSLFQKLQKMREEKEKLENEIIQKRKDLDSGFRELKFIKDEMEKSNKSEGTDKIVDAASAVVASMNQKLQTTLTELNAVKKALENEREHQKKSGKLD